MLCADGPGLISRSWLSSWPAMYPHRRREMKQVKTLKRFSCHSHVPIAYIGVVYARGSYVQVLPYHQSLISQTNIVEE